MLLIFGYLLVNLSSVNLSLSLTCRLSFVTYSLLIFCCLSFCYLLTAYLHHLLVAYRLLLIVCHLLVLLLACCLSFVTYLCYLPLVAHLCYLLPVMYRCLLLLIFHYVSFATYSLSFVTYLSLLLTRRPTFVYLLVLATYFLLLTCLCCLSFATYLC